MARDGANMYISPFLSKSVPFPEADLTADGAIDLMDINYANNQYPILQNYFYSPFGELWQGESSTDTNPVRYCGEYYDSETGLIYLRARYYDPSIGRFISVDPIKDGTNWYIYCSNNPVAFVDPSGLYKRENAVNYALKYGKLSWYEHYPIRFDNDCTNFASNTLFAGGIKKTSDWYLNFVMLFIGKVIGPLSSYSPTWTVADEQYKWISDPSNGYINGDVLELRDSNSIAQIVSDNNIQPGDLMYWDFNGDSHIDHTSIIVSIENNDVTYAQHSRDRVNGSLKKQLDENPEYCIYIIRIKDSAE